MNRPTLTAALLILICIPLGVANGQLNLGTTSYGYHPYMPELGRGFASWNPSEKKDVAIKCVEPTRRPNKAPTFRLSFKAVTSESSFQEAMGVDASLHVGFGLAAADATFGLSESTERRTSERVFVINVRQTHRVENCEEWRMSDAAKKIHETGSRRQFLEQYGNQATVAVTWGISTSLIVRLLDDSQFSEEHIKANASFDSLQAAASAEFWKSLSKANQEEALTISADQIGGPPGDQLLTMISQLISSKEEITFKKVLNVLTDYQSKCSSEYAVPIGFKVVNIPGLREEWSIRPENVTALNRVSRLKQKVDVQVRLLERLKEAVGGADAFTKDEKELVARVYEQRCRLQTEVSRAIDSLLYEASAGQQVSEPILDDQSETSLRKLSFQALLPGEYRLSSTSAHRDNRSASISRAGSGEDFTFEQTIAHEQNKYRNLHSQVEPNEKCVQACVAA